MLTYDRRPRSKATNKSINTAPPTTQTQVLLKKPLPALMLTSTLFVASWAKTNIDKITERVVSKALLKYLML